MRECEFNIYVEEMGRVSKKECKCEIERERAREKERERERHYNKWPRNADTNNGKRDQ